MKIEDIEKELVKQKDPLTYLEKLLKKTKDKNLAEKIKKLIEKLKSLKKPKNTLEHNLENMIRRAPRIPIEEPEPEKIERPITVTRATIPAIALEVPEKKAEDYGIKPGKADYDVSTESIKHDLQQSHQITEHGFVGTETQHLFDEKSGEYSIEEHRHYIPEEQPGYVGHKEEFKFVPEDTAKEATGGLTNIEIEVKRKKKGIFEPRYK